MKPVLTFFFDALKPESLQYMPFLDSLPFKRRMRTELGYSVACHPSMYSGVHPDKHLQWFVWKYAPETSPFQWTKALKLLDLVDNLPLRYFLHKYTRQYRRNNTSWFGVPLLVNLPLKYWHYFDVAEDRSWDEPGYLRQYPTVFDILRNNQLAFEVIGMTRGAGDEFSQIGGHTFGEIKPWTYFFLGSVDSYSHHYRQDSLETIDRMKRLDALVEDQFNAYSKQVQDFDMIVFSDHGHIPVENQVDIQAIFKKHKQPINKFLHLVEANYARFWFRSDQERAKVEKILLTIDGGYVLTEETLRKYHVLMPDNRYGDLVFYLDQPAIFSKTIWGFGRTQQSMHGYLPDYPASDGVFLSQRPLVDGTHVDLVDVLPTTLQSLGVNIPGYIDGRSAWADASQEPGSLFYRTGQT